MSEENKMPERLFAIVHCGCRGWTTDVRIAENAIKSAEYIRADLTPVSAEDLQKVKRLLIQIGGETIFTQSKRRADEALAILDRIAKETK